MTWFLLTFNYLVLYYFLAINSVYFLLILLGFFSIRRNRHYSFLLDNEQIIQSGHTRPISLIVPAYNEEASIISSVASLLQQQYPNFEVIIVNDGSTDRTLELVIERYGMVPSVLHYRHQLPCKPINAIYVSPDYPNLIVVDKENGKKADSMNAGINVCRYPLFLALDADSLLEKDALLKSIRPFLEDPETLAVGGSLRVVNGCYVNQGEVVEVRAPRRWLECCQVIEYLRSFLYGRVGWDAIGATLIVSGAYGLFNKQAVISAGGYDAKSLGEDMELIVRLRRWAYKHMERHHVTFMPQTVCWTQVPSTLAVFKNQRSRWMRGLMQILWMQKTMFFNPRYGTMGVIALPFFLLFEFLGPVLETLGLVVFILCWVFGLINWEFAVLFLFVAVVLGALLSIASVVLMELTDRRYHRLRDVIKLLLYSPLDSFGFRQIHNYCRMQGIVEYLIGSRGWGNMKKSGFGPLHRGSGAAEG